MQISLICISTLQLQKLATWIEHIFLLEQFHSVLVSTNKQQGCCLGFKAGRTADDLGGIQVWFNYIRFNGLDWITLTRNDVFHQKPGSFFNVYVFLQVKKKNELVIESLEAL